MKYDKWISSNVGRKIQGWLTIITIIFAFGYNGYNFLFNESILSLIVIICFVILWLYIFYYIYGGIRKYISFSVGLKFEVDPLKWYNFVNEDKEYQNIIIDWLADNKIKYYKNYGSTFYFLKKTDLMAFKLRWI